MTKTRRNVLVAGSIAAAAVVVAVYLLLPRDPDPPATAARALLDRYCIDCHNRIDFAGSLDLEQMRFTDVGLDAETWEHVVRKLNAGMMPPAGKPRPARATTNEFVAELESRLDRAAERNPVAERTALRRLNRTEYGNAIRDLLHFDIDAATLLPLDDSSEGFDNIATALTVSPSLVESYVSAAMKISRWALGDRTAPRTQAAYAAPQGLAQDRHLDGMPLGTRGGMRVEHFFPVDAEYEISIGRGFFGRGARLEVTLDGEPLAAGGRGQIRIPITAGPHMLVATLVDTTRSTGVDDVYGEFRAPGGIGSIEIDGPLDATGVGDTPSRRRILVCEPTSKEDEESCAEEIVTTLATRAFRRPLPREDLPKLMEFFEAGSAESGFEAGIQHALSRILVDPRFLYRFEPAPPTAPAGTIFEVDDFALASRLSFFLWSSIPDDELLELAARGRLHEPATLDAQVRRMLSDPKADALTENFAAQWLFLRELDSVTPDAEGFDENLRSAMLRETKLLFDAIVREDMSIMRLLDADFTFIDERLAEHYGIEDIRGSHFRRIEIPAENPRRGLLGHASILTVTSVTNRTSPVIRGRWILETVLGSPAPVPPPNVETTLEGDDGAAVASTVRERLEAHRANPNCASCHAIMDPIGFALENFDSIGAWRETDGGRPIDAGGTLVDGTAVGSAADLRAALLDRSDAFVTTTVEKLLTYALGRRLEYHDMPAVRAMVREASAEDYRFSALIRGIVHSDTFQTAVKGASE